MCCTREGEEGNGEGKPTQIGIVLQEKFTSIMHGKYGKMPEREELNLQISEGWWMKGKISNWINIYYIDYYNNYSNLIVFYRIYCTFNSLPYWIIQQFNYFISLFAVILMTPTSCSTPYRMLLLIIIRSNFKPLWLLSLCALILYKSDGITRQMPRLTNNELRPEMIIKPT